MTHAILTETLLPIYADLVGINRAARAMRAAITWADWSGVTRPEDRR